METKEQKIERLKAKIKKEKWWYNQWNKTKLSFISGCMKWEIKQTIIKLEQELKELEEEYKRDVKQYQTLSYAYKLS